MLRRTLIRLAPRKEVVREARTKFAKTKEHLNVSTIGHVDHGKTTLTAAITHCMSKKGSAKARKYEDIDSSPEEKARKITINATTVEYETDKRHYGHIDCPGHADYVKNMIVGSSQIDGGILVVSASEGVMPQTKEHVLLAHQTGIKNLIVFLNKCDAPEVDADTIELVEDEVKELLKKHQFNPDTVPFIRGSALKALEGDPKWEAKIYELMETLDRAIASPDRPKNEPFLMPIEGVLQISGKGTVITGKIEKGTVKVGDKVSVIGYKQHPDVTVTAVETFRKLLDEASAGDNVGLLVKGANKDTLQRGQVAAQPNSSKPHNQFRATVYINTKEEGGRRNAFYRGYRPQFYIRTADVPGDIEFPEYEGKTDAEIRVLEEKEKKMVMPGDNREIIVNLMHPVALREGLNFAMREGGMTVGFGKILKVQ